MENMFTILDFLTNYVKISKREILWCLQYHLLIVEFINEVIAIIVTFHRFYFRVY